MPVTTAGESTVVVALAVLLALTGSPIAAPAVPYAGESAGSLSFISWNIPGR